MWEMATNEDGVDVDRMMIEHELELSILRDRVAELLSMLIEVRPYLNHAPKADITQRVDDVIRGDA
jgi:hypothetical protein